MCSEECFVSYNTWNVGTPLRSTYPATPPSISRYDGTRRELVPEAEKIWSRKELLSVTSSCDRFIPNRRLADNELSNFLLLRSKKNGIFSESLTRRGSSHRLQNQNRRQNSDRNQNNVQRANNNVCRLAVRLSKSLADIDIHIIIIILLIILL